MENNLEKLTRKELIAEVERRIELFYKEDPMVLRVETGLFYGVNYRHCSKKELIRALEFDDKFSIIRKDFNIAAKNATGALEKANPLSKYF